MIGTSEDACAIKRAVGRTNVQNPLDFVTALLVDRRYSAGARFPTRALEIKVRSVFQVFFSEIRHTLGSVRHRGGLGFRQKQRNMCHA